MPQAGLVSWKDVEQYKARAGLVSWQQVQQFKDGSQAKPAVKPAAPQPTPSKPAPSCSLGVIKEAEILVQYNDEILSRYIGTKILLSMHTGHNCSNEETLQLYKDIDWDNHTDFVQRGYAEEVLVPCVNKIINLAKLDPVCLAKAKAARDKFMRDDDRVRAMIKSSCAWQPQPQSQPPTAASKKDDTTKKVFSCSGRDISPAMLEWLSNTQDGLTDKRLLCFLHGAVTVALGDTVGSHTVWQLDDKVVGIALKDEKKQQQTSSWGLSSLLRAGGRLVYDIFNLLLKSIFFMAKLAACGLDFILSKLWLLKIGACLLLIYLYSTGYLSVETVIKIIIDYALPNAMTVVELLSVVCTLGFTPAAFALFLLVHLNGTTPVFSGTKTEIMLKLLFKLFIPLMALLCFLKYSDFFATVGKVWSGGDDGGGGGGGLFHSMKQFWSSMVSEGNFGQVPDITPGPPDLPLSTDLVTGAPAETVSELSNVVDFYQNLPANQLAEINQGLPPAVREEGASFVQGLWNAVRNGVQQMTGQAPAQAAVASLPQFTPAVPALTPQFTPQFTPTLTPLPPIGAPPASLPTPLPTPALIPAALSPAATSLTPAVTPADLLVQQVADNLPVVPTSMSNTIDFIGHYWNRALQAGVTAVGGQSLVNYLQQNPNAFVAVLRNLKSMTDYVQAFLLRRPGLLLN